MALRGNGYNIHGHAFVLCLACPILIHAPPLPPMKLRLGQFHHLRPLVCLTCETRRQAEVVRLKGKLDFWEAPSSRASIHAELAFHLTQLFKADLLTYWFSLVGLFLVGAYKVNLLLMGPLGK